MVRHLQRYEGDFFHTALSIFIRLHPCCLSNSAVIGLISKVFDLLSDMDLVSLFFFFNTARRNGGIWEFQ